MPADGEAPGQTPTLQLPRRTGITLAIIGVLHVINGAYSVFSTLADPSSGARVLDWGTMLAGAAGLFLVLDLAARGERSARVAGLGLLAWLALLVPLLWSPSQGLRDDAYEIAYFGGLLAASVTVPLAYQHARDQDPRPFHVAMIAAILFIVAAGPHAWAALGEMRAMATRLLPAWAGLIASLAQVALGLAIAWSTQVASHLPDRWSSDRFAVTPWVVAALGALIFSWMAGGSFLFVTIWALPLILLVLPAFLEILERPLKAGFTALLLSVGLLFPVTCRAWKTSDDGFRGWVTAEGSLAELAMRGPAWSEGGAFVNVDAACHPAVVAVAGLLALSLIVLAMWQPPKRESPALERWLPIRRFRTWVTGEDASARIGVIAVAWLVSTLASAWMLVRSVDPFTLPRIAFLFALPSVLVGAFLLYVPLSRGLGRLKATVSGIGLYLVGAPLPLLFPGRWARVVADPLRAVVLSLHWPGFLLARIGLCPLTTVCP